MGFIESFGFGFVILLLVALVVSSVGFYKYVYFISLGYGFSVAAMSIAMCIMGFRLFHVFGIGIGLMCVFFLIYGCRLGGYLLVRELKSSSYRDTMKKEIKDGSSMKLVAKVSIWVSCSLLYVLQVSPLLFRLMAGKGKNEKIDAVMVAGVCIMALDILVESIADLQKSKSKKKNPSRFCDSGLYKLVRCPNYLGEVIFWTGVFVSGIPIYASVWQWVAAFLGYVCIVYIMFGGARRLELRQNRNYGEDPEYQEYIKKTPILIPLVPLYSVAKHKWLVG